MINESSLSFLKKLVETPSPSGFEEPVAALVREYVRPFASDMQTDRMGNMSAVVNPSGSPRIMLAGHMDEIGFLVHYISDEGCCYFRGIGGHDLSIVVGQRVEIHTQRGSVPGVIGKKPIHLLNDDERGKKLDMHEMWIDIGATGGAREVEDAGIQVGDPVTFAPSYAHLLGENITARGLDNRIGVWVVFEALRRVAEMNPRAAVYSVATVQEEIGLRGARASAFGIDPEIGIAVDVTFASDYPSMDKRKNSPLNLGAGPAILRGANASRKLSDRLIRVAAGGNLPYQLEATPGGTGTDANPMQFSRAGMTTSLVSIPLRYMHTPCEIISLTDADNAAQLLALTCADISPEDDWTP